MANSFLNANEKQQLSLVLDDLHETFARNIIVIKNAERVIITEDPNYSFAYGDSQSISTIEYTPTSGVFKGRVKWMDIEDKNSLYFNQDIRPASFSNYCRIKIDPSGYHFLTGTKEVWVDNIKCDWEGNVRPHGLFDVKYYTIFVRASS